MEDDPYNFLCLIAGLSVQADVIYYCLLLIVLLFLSGLFSGSELAFFSLSRKTLEEYSQSKDSTENNVAKLLKKPQKLLATILVSDNMVNVAIVLISEYIIRRTFNFDGNEVIRFLVSIVITTLLLLLFGEVLPKVYANNNNKSVAKATAGLFSVLNKIMYLLTAPLMAFSSVLEKWVKRGNKGTISVMELEKALELSSGNTNTDEDDKKMLEGIISFGKTEAKQVMTPRINMVALSNEDSFDKVKKLIQKTAYSRLPVYDENPDRILGILYIKDLLKVLSEKDFQWTTILRKPFFVPENRKIDDILIDFQQKKTHIAIVVDEYGGTAGIISMDDIISEIVGEISDEFDDDEDQVTEHNNNEYTLDGQLSLKDFYRALELSDETEELFEQRKGEAESLAGFILELSGVFPKKDQEIKFYNYSFTISSIDRKRIKQIKLKIEKPTNEAAS